MARKPLYSCFFADGYFYLYRRDEFQFLFSVYVLVDILNTLHLLVYSFGIGP